VAQKKKTATNVLLTIFYFFLLTTTWNTKNRANTRGEKERKKIDNSTNNAKEDNHIHKGDTNNGKTNNGCWLFFQRIRVYKNDTSLKKRL